VTDDAILHQVSVFMVVIIRAYCVPRNSAVSIFVLFFNIHQIGSITAVFTDFCSVGVVGGISPIRSPQQQNHGKCDFCYILNHGRIFIQYVRCSSFPSCVTAHAAATRFTATTILWSGPLWFHYQYSYSTRHCTGRRFLEFLIDTDTGYELTHDKTQRPIYSIIYSLILTSRLLGSLKRLLWIRP
jgi:hypothetical protein